MKYAQVKKTILGNVKRIWTSKSQVNALREEMTGFSFCTSKVPMEFKMSFLVLLLSSQMAMAQQSASSGLNTTQMKAVASLQITNSINSENIDVKNLKNSSVSQSKLNKQSLSQIQSLKNTKAAQGGSSDGGGYRTFTARQWIKEAAGDAALHVEFSNESHLNENPQNRKIVITALKNIEIQANASRRRNGDDLLLDYDKARGRIIVLKSFFDIFTAASNRELAIPAIKTLLLHECGHLIGLIDDESAEEFAQNVQSRRNLVEIQPNYNDPCGTLWKMAPLDGDKEDMDNFNSYYQEICHGGAIDEGVALDHSELVVLSTACPSTAPLLAGAEYILNSSDGIVMWITYKLSHTAHQDCQTEITNRSKQRDPM